MAELETSLKRTDTGTIAPKKYFVVSRRTGKKYSCKKCLQRMLVHGIEQECW